MCHWVFVARSFETSSSSAGCPMFLDQYLRKLRDSLENWTLAVSSVVYHWVIMAHVLLLFCILGVRWGWVLCYCSLKWAKCTRQDDGWEWRIGGMIRGREILKCWDKNLPQCHFFTTISMCTTLELNSGHVMNASTSDTVAAAVTWSNLLEHERAQCKVWMLLLCVESHQFWMTAFPLYRWNCYKSVPSMHRTGHTFSSSLFRTRQDAHAQTKSRWIISCGKGPTSCTGIS